MPYKSKAQEKFFNANRKKLEAKGVNVSEFNKASKGKKLPPKTRKTWDSNRWESDDLGSSYGG
jgi:hypothetical protein